jgi:hypothetical protein
MQSLYEHIVQLFAQAAIEILADPDMSFINPSNPYISLPYLILQTLNQNLPPKNLRSMPPHIVRSLVSVVVSFFALPWPDNNSQSSKKQNNLPIQNLNNNQKMNGNETDNETSAGDIDLKYKKTRPSINVINDGLLTPGSLKQSSEIDILKLAKIYIEYLWNEGWKNEVVELVKEAVSSFFFLKKKKKNFFFYYSFIDFLLTILV